MKNKYCIISTTFNDRKKAKKLIKKLLTGKLAACIQIHEIESFYGWKNKRCNEKEFSLSIKTASHLYKEVEMCILENNPYETPEIIMVPIKKGNKDYLKWINDSVKEMPISENNEQSTL